MPKTLLENSKLSICMGVDDYDDTREGRHIFKTNRERFEFIDKNCFWFPLEKMCQTLEVSKSGYYAWKKWLGPIEQKRGSSKT